jgi:hypothetical protein
MPSYFNIQNFYEKHNHEIDQLCEIFPQIGLEEVTLLFYENNCDINLILTRLSSGESFKKKLPKNLTESKKKKFSFESPKRAEIVKESDPEKLTKSLAIEEETLSVNFMFNHCSSMLVELPPVVFPFWVPNNNTTSSPVFYSFCSKY